MNFSAYMTAVNEERRIIGENVRRLRKEAGLSVDDLMERKRIPISRPYWYEIEQGVCNPSITNLVVVAEALGVSLRDLLEEAPKPKRDPGGGRRAAEAVRN